MTDAKFAALERAYALGALSDDLYETARARLLEEIAAAPAAAPAPAPANSAGDGAVAITALPTEILSLVVAQLCLVRNIKGVKRTCRAFRDAAPEAEKAIRRVCFEHADAVRCVAAVPGGRVITGSDDKTVKVWRDGACERTIQADTDHGWAVAMWRTCREERASSASPLDGTAQLWTMDGAIERIFAAGIPVVCVAAMPDDVHFVVGLGGGGPSSGEVRLYHVDGTFVQWTWRNVHWALKAHTDAVTTVTVTPDGKHIISGAQDGLVCLRDCHVLGRCLGRPLVLVGLSCLFWRAHAATAIGWARTTRTSEEMERTFL